MKNYLELVEKMEALALKATPGPFTVEDWLDQEEETVYVQSASIGTVARVPTLPDAEFIAASREAVPELCKAVHELYQLLGATQAENAELRDN